MGSSPSTHVSVRVRDRHDSTPQPSVSAAQNANNPNVELPPAETEVKQTNLSPLGPGEIDVGDYRIELYQVIGWGAFGQVCRANNRVNGEIIAAKRITVANHGGRNDGLKAMAIAEGEQMKSMRHPNIVKLFDYCEHENTIWLFMEFCELGDLNNYLAKNPNLSFRQRLQIMHEMTLAVSYIHCHDMIHRDIKPENTLIKEVNNKPVAKLTDFGYAKIYDYSSSQPTFSTKQNTSSAGTPRYWAPELFPKKGDINYTSSVDVFSLGLMFAVIHDYGPDNLARPDQATFPLSVESRKASILELFGREMANAYREGQPLPHIVEITPNDYDLERKLKQLISQMTAFDSKQRSKIEHVKIIIESITGIQANDLLSDLLHKQLKQVKQVKLSHGPLSLKLVEDELWSCQWDGIAVYSRDLELLRTVPAHGDLPWVHSVVLLPDHTVAVAGLKQLYQVTQSGEFIKALADGWYSDVAVHGGELYAASEESPVIDVYDCHTWSKLRTIHTPCPDSEHDINWHYLCVNDIHIKLSCLDLNIIYTLDTQGTHKASHGPYISITQSPSHAAESEHSTSASRLNMPYICQGDDAGAVLVADEDNNRLLVLSEAGQWREVRLNQELSTPTGAVWWRGRLYVSTWGHLTIFE